MDEQATKNAQMGDFSNKFGAPGGYKLEPLSAATIIAHFLYEHNEPGLFTLQRFTREELTQLRSQAEYKV